MGEVQFAGAGLTSLWYEETGEELRYRAVKGFSAMTA